MNSESVSSIESPRKSGPEELTTQQTQKIFRTVYRITRNREDTEDAMQDAFMQALKHFEDFDGRAAFSTWLTRIAINSALMILRKRKNGRLFRWMARVIPRSPTPYGQPETRRRMPNSDACKKNEKQPFETQSWSFVPVSGALLNLGT